MSLKAELGRAVRFHRERVGLSQLELSEAIGRSTQSLSNFERGETMPGLETLELIAKALETPVRDFFPVEQPAEDVITARIATRVSKLTTPEKVWVEAMLTTALQKPKS